MAAVEIQQLKYLLAAVRHGNFVKAAEASNITQSGLSRSITTLEQRLGVPLLVRTATGVTPTVFGLSVLRRANLILNEVERATHEIRAIEEGRTGDVSIGITQNYAHYFIPGLLAEFQRDRPDIRVRVMTGGFIDLSRSVAAGELDFAFGLIGPIEVPDDLIIEPLREHYARVVANASHPLATALEVTVEDLAAARWATLTGEGFQRNFVDFFTMRGQPQPTQTLTTDSIDLIRRIVLTTDMLTVLPANVVLAEVEAGNIVILPCDTPAEVTQIGLVFRPSSLIAPPVRMLTEAIRAAMRP
jgi:DNA-binding transcriptional LysR family regulator